MTTDRMNFTEVETEVKFIKNTSTYFGYYIKKLFNLNSTNSQANNVKDYSWNFSVNHKNVFNRKVFLFIETKCKTDTKV